MLCSSTGGSTEENISCARFITYSRTRSLDMPRDDTCSSDAFAMLERSSAPARHGIQRPGVRLECGRCAAFPGEHADALEAAFDEIPNMRAIIHESLDRAAHRSDIATVEQLGGVAGDLEKSRRVGACDRYAARHRLEHREAEALEQ